MRSVCRWGGHQPGGEDTQKYNIQGVPQKITPCLLWPSKQGVIFCGTPCRWDFKLPGGFIYYCCVISKSTRTISTIVQNVYTLCLWEIRKYFQSSFDIITQTQWRGGQERSQEVAREVSINPLIKLRPQNGRGRSRDLDTGLWLVSQLL